MRRAGHDRRTRASWDQPRGGERRTRPVGGPLTRRGLLALAITGGLGAIAGCAGPAPAPNGPTPRSEGIAEPTPSRILGIIPVALPATATPTPTSVVVRFAHWETGRAGQILAQVCDRFGQTTPRIAVAQDVAPFGEHFAKLRSAFAAGNPPDAFVESGAYAYRHLADQALRDLRPFLARDGPPLDRYWSEPLTGVIDGHQFAVPLWAAVELIYLNRDRFAEVGVSPPTADWTWDTLLAAATRLTEGKPGEIRRWGLLVVNDLVGGWGSFVASNGGQWLDLATGRTRFDPAAAEALGWIVEAMNVRHVAPRPIEQQRLTGAGQLDPFLSGAVAMFATGTWEMPSALAQARFQWDVQRLPRAPRRDRSSTVGSVQPGSIARQSAHPDDAWRLLRFLLEPETQRAWASGKIRLPSSKEVAADANAGYATPPPTGAPLAAAAMGDARDLQFTVNWQDWRAAVVAALAPAFAGEMPLAEALARATTAGDAALGSPQTTPRA